MNEPTLAEHSAEKTSQERIGLAHFDPDALDYNKGGGLVTVVTQDVVTGAVLMVAFANREAVMMTVSTGEMHYTSRRRGLWRKGETSGNTQRVVSLTADCDGDAVLARVHTAGPACHNGTFSCFREDALLSDALSITDAIISERARNSEAVASYTRRLLGDRNLRLKKIGEEAMEFAIACADEDKDRMKEEAADLLYHLLVALRVSGLGLADVREVLIDRSR